MLAVITRFFVACLKIPVLLKISVPAYLVYNLTELLNFSKKEEHAFK